MRRRRPRRNCWRRCDDAKQIVSLRAPLERLAATRGVVSAAVASREGFVLDGVSRSDEDQEFVAGLVASGLASSQALADLFGDGALRQATIEYDRGPVLLVPLEGEAADHLVLVVLEDMASLGRVRLQLRRLLPELARAATA